MTDGVRWGRRRRREDDTTGTDRATRSPAAGQAAEQAPGPGAGPAAAPPSGLLPNEDTVRQLLASHGVYARELVAQEMRRRNGRHCSITPSEFGNDIVLEAAGLDIAGSPRTAAAWLTPDDPRVRPRIDQRIIWRFNDRERLSRVKARRTAVNVHDGWDAADPRADDPLERAATREAADRAAWIRDHRREVEATATAEAAPDGRSAASTSSGIRPSADAAARSNAETFIADEATPDAAARLHAFARHDAQSDPKAARQLALHVLVEILGIPVATARAAIRITRSTAYRDLDEMKRRLDDPARE